MLYILYVYTVIISVFYSQQKMEGKHESDPVTTVASQRSIFTSSLHFSIRNSLRQSGCRCLHTYSVAWLRETAGLSGYDFKGFFVILLRHSRAPPMIESRAAAPPINRACPNPNLQRDKTNQRPEIKHTISRTSDVNYNRRTKSSNVQKQNTHLRVPSDWNL